MKKRLIINESQLNFILDNYNEEVIEEGLKEKMTILGLTLFSTFAGIGQKKIDVTPETIKAAQTVQDKLESGDETLYTFFDEAGIEKNRDNLNKLINADLKKGLRKTTAKSPEELEKKLKYGYVATDFKIGRDTLMKELPSKTTFQNAVVVDVSGDMFKTGEWKLSESVMKEFSNVIDVIQSRNGKITKLKIESSTDTEHIDMGNEKLARLRATVMVKYLSGLGVNVSQAEIETLPEQGSEVVDSVTFKKASNNLSKAKKSGKKELIEKYSNELENLRDKTSDFRYVKVLMEFEFKKPELREPKTVIEYIETLEVELVRPISTDKGEKIPPITKRIPPKKCKIKVPKDKGKVRVYKCPKNFGI
jgi:hypothetical protein